METPFFFFFSLNNDQSLYGFKKGYIALITEFLTVKFFGLLEMV